MTQRGRYTRCRGGRGRLSGIRGARSRVRTYKSSKTSNATSMSSSFPDKCVSITVKDESFQRPISNEFCPLRECGPHFPQNYEITPLSLFELYFDNEVVERILHCSLAYAESIIQLLTKHLLTYLSTKKIFLLLLEVCFFLEYME